MAAGKQTDNDTVAQRFLWKSGTESQRLDIGVAKVITIIIPNYSGGK